MAALFLDMGNVLINFDHRLVCRAAAERFGIDEARFADFVFARGLEGAYDGGSISTSAFVGLIEGEFRRGITVETFAPVWNGMFWPHPGMEEIVRSLKGQVPLLLLSNTNELHYGFVEGRYPVLSLFDRVCLSYREKVRKPEPGIFARACALMGRTPGECWFFDDKPEFAAAARAAGLVGRTFTTVERFREDLRDFFRVHAPGG